jgi:hypothetical protein
VNNSNEAAIVMQLAAYIRNLGFQAIASMNDTALVIPYAIKAGLGEYGRNQMVLTLEFGPRVRLAFGFARSTTTIKERSGIGWQRHGGAMSRIGGPNVQRLHVSNRHCGGDRARLKLRLQLGRFR